MKASIILFLTLIISIYAVAQTQLPADKKATLETVRLYNNLKRLQNKGYLFGHQDDLAYGVKWKYVKGKSDVKDLTGDYPALYGWDLSHLELNEKVNIDTVPFENIKQYIKQAYERGSVNTLSWHGTNPLTGKSAWDNTAGTVASILPGGQKHQLYKEDLDKIAAFLSGLKGKHGELIPIIYRPFHELSGGWFWWGNKSCSSQEFKTIFRFTLHYLRDIKHVHNLLYAYNTVDSFNTADDFLERYPGDDLIDILSFDAYAYGEASLTGPKFVKSIDTHLSIIEKLAKEKNKIAALAEVGYNNIPDANWWTNVLAKSLNGHHISYVLLWRNAGYKAADKSTEYYVPYPGDLSADNFVEFYKLPQTLFQKEASQEKLYK